MIALCNTTLENSFCSLYSLLFQQRSSVGFVSRRLSIGVESSKFLGVQRIFAQKVVQFCQPFFFGVTSKKWSSLVFICKCWAPFFEVKQRWAQFCPNFQGFCPEFQQIKTFGGALAPPALTPPTPLRLSTDCFCRSHVILFL